MIQIILLLLNLFLTNNIVSSAWYERGLDPQSKDEIRKHLSSYYSEDKLDKAVLEREKKELESSDSNEAWLDRITQRSLTSLSKKEQEGILEELRGNKKIQTFLAGKGNNQYVNWLVRQPKKILNQKDKYGTFPMELPTEMWISESFDPKTTLMPLIQHKLVDYEIEDHNGDRFLARCVDYRPWNMGDLRAKLYFVLNVAAEPGQDELAAELKKIPKDKELRYEEQGKKLSYGQILLNAYDGEKKSGEKDEVTPEARAMIQGGILYNLRNKIYQFMFGNPQSGSVESSTGGSPWKKRIAAVLGLGLGAITLSRIYNYFYPDTDILSSIKK